MRRNIPLIDVELIAVSVMRDQAQHCFTA